MHIFTFGLSVCVLRYQVEAGLCFFVIPSVTSLWMGSYISVLSCWRLRSFMDDMMITLVLVIGILMEHMEHLDSMMVHVAYGVYYLDV